jgi:hypothetical protein
MEQKGWGITLAEYVLLLKIAMNAAAPDGAPPRRFKDGLWLCKEKLVTLNPETTR